MSVFTALKAAILALTLATHGPAIAAEPDGLWGEPFIGSDPTLLYLPDANATYWRYGWTRKPGDTGGMIVTGTVPDVRYFSYNVYDDDTKQSLGSVPDYRIVLDGNAPNPFAGGEAGAGSYTIHVVPEGTALDGPNVLTFPDDIRNVSIFLRHYLPRPRTDIHGGEPIPLIERFDPASGNAGAAPVGTDIPPISMKEIQRYLAPMAKIFLDEHEGDMPAALAALREKAAQGTMTLPELVVKQVVAPAFGYNDYTDTLRSYRLDTSGNYPTADNHYLVLPVIRQAPDQVLVAKFRAPDYASVPAEYPTAPLRYFSVSQGDEQTYNYSTLHDAEITVAPDGFAYFVIGADTPALRDKAAALNANFMPWAVKEKMMLVYRNMLPRADFPYGVDKVPFLDKTLPIAPQAADEFIGDSALTGKLIDEAAFLETSAIPAF